MYHKSFAFGLLAVLSLATMATTSDLAADLQQGRQPDAWLVLTGTATRLDTGAEASYSFRSRGASAIPDIPTADLVLEGLELDGGIVSRLTGTDGGAPALVMGRTELDVGGVRVNIMAQPGNGFRGQVAAVNGAAAAGAYSVAVDGLDPGRVLRMGDRFQIAGDPDHYWTVLADAQASAAGEATVAVWPAIPTGGWADNLGLESYEPRDPWITNSPASALRAYSFKGHTGAELAVVGRRHSDGEAVAWADRGILYDAAKVTRSSLGEATRKTPNGPVSGTLTLELSPPGERLDRTLAHPLTGHGACPVGDPTLSPVVFETSTVSPWQPDGAGKTGDIFMLASEVRVFEQVRGDTARKTIIASGDPDTPDSGSYGLEFSSADMTFTAWVSIGSTLYDVASVPVSLEHRYAVLATYRASVGLLTIWTVDLDDHARPLTVGDDKDTIPDSYSSAGGQLTLWGHPSGTTAERFEGTIGQIVLFDGANAATDPVDTDAKRKALMTRRIAPSETGLGDQMAEFSEINLTGSVLYGRGPATGYNPSASPTSGFEAANQGAAELVGHTLQGGPFLAGKYLDVALGKSLNMPGAAVASSEEEASDFFIYPASDRGTGPHLAHLDGGVVQTPGDEWSSSRDLLVVDPGVGEVDHWRQFYRFSSAPTLSPLCDTWGDSFYETGFHFDGAASYGAASLTAIFGADFSVSGWAILSPDAADPTNFNFIAGDIDDVGKTGWALKYSSTSLNLNVWLDSGSVQQLDASPPAFYTPFFWTITVSESGGDTTTKLYVNSIEVATDTTTGGITTPTKNFEVGREAQSTALHILGNMNEISVFDHAMTASDTFEMMVYPDYAPSGGVAEHRWSEPDSDLDPAVWTDTGATGGANLTMTSTTVGKPVPIGNLPCALQHLMTLRGSVNKASLDISNASVLSAEMRGAPINGDASVLDAVDRARGEAGSLVYRQQSAQWIWQPLAALTGATATVTIYPDWWEGPEAPPQGEQRDPPLLVAVGHSRVGSTQEELLPGATDQRRALVAPPGIRFEDAAVAGAENYADPRPRDEYPSSYVSADDAHPAAEALATIVAEAPIRITSQDRDWITAAPAGTVVKFIGPQVTGGVMLGLVVESAITGSTPRDMRRLIVAAAIPA